MSIVFQCQKCQELMRVPEGTQGSDTDCPLCGHRMSIPSSTESPSQPPPPPAAGFATPADHAEPSPPPPSTNPYAEDYQARSANPYAPSSADVNRADSQAEVQARLQLPAIFVLVTSIILFLMCAFALLGGIFAVIENGLNEEILPLVMVSGIALCQLLAIWGSICMLRLRNYKIAFVGSIAGATGGVLCCLLPSAFSIWALVVLVSQDAKRFFT